MTNEEEIEYEVTVRIKKKDGTFKEETIEVLSHSKSNAKLKAEWILINKYEDAEETEAIDVQEII